MTTYREAIKTVLASLTDPQTGEIRSFKDIDVADVRALTNELRAAQGDIEKLQNSHAWKRTKKTMEAIRKESNVQLKVNGNAIVRLNSGELDQWARCRVGYAKGADFIPVMLKNRKKLADKQAAIYRLEKTLLRSIEGNVPKVLAQREQLEIEF